MNELKRQKIKSLVEQGAFATTSNHRISLIHAVGIILAFGAGLAAAALLFNN